MSSNIKNYKYITLEDKVIDVMNHPAFKGFGFYLFPLNDKSRYSRQHEIERCLYSESMAYEFKSPWRSRGIKSTYRRYK